MRVFLPDFISKPQTTNPELNMLKRRNKIKQKIIKKSPRQLTLTPVKTSRIDFQDLKTDNLYAKHQSLMIDNSSQYKGVDLMSFDNNRKIPLKTQSRPIHSRGSFNVQRKSYYLLDKQKKQQNIGQKPDKPNNQTNTKRKQIILICQKTITPISQEKRTPRKQFFPFKEIKIKRNTNSVMSQQRAKRKSQSQSQRQYRPWSPDKFILDEIGI